MASYSSLQKGDKGKPDNYTSQYPYLVFDKLFEKLTYNRFYNFLQTYDILYKYQFGFRRCNSTSLALIEIVDNIYANINSCNHTIGIFLDLEKAFDTVDHKIL